MDYSSLLQTIHYIVQKTIELKNTYLDEKDLPIDFLTIFTHSVEEFKQYDKLLRSLGKIVYEHNGPTFLLHKPIQISTGLLKILRIRTPDPERPQVGCDDFRVKNYATFKEKYLNKNPEHIIFIKRPDLEMFEIRDSQFDVLTYIPDIPLTQILNISTDNSQY
jgi:hypothetical protein